MNHPQRRLALASHWLASERLTAHIEEWCVASIPEREWLPSLHKIFQVERDEFWVVALDKLQIHAVGETPQPLLGEGRVTDLAINVVLPWLWIRTKEGGNEKILNEVERRFFGWPAARR